MRKFALAILLVIFSKGSTAMSAPDDPELMERSLAAANMRGFSHDLLLDALIPEDETSKKMSKEELYRLIESEQGQEAARSAAMRSMLSRSRARGADGWLGGMCDSMPWLSWLIQCAESDEMLGPEHREDESTEPNTLVILDYEWATCQEEGDYEEENNL